MALVTVIVGSISDRSIIDPALELFKKFDVAFSLKVCSAHRDPDRLVSEIRDAEEKGTQVFIAAAGMAAHLAGAVSAHTIKPVIGIPVSSGPMHGKDSLLSTVMMPPGIPVATVGIDGAVNAAWLAIQILATLPGQERLKSVLTDERALMKLKLLKAEERWVSEL